MAQLAARRLTLGRAHITITGGPGGGPYDRGMVDARRLAALSALGVVGALAAREGLRRSRAATAGPIVDWDLVRRTAHRRCGEPTADLQTSRRLEALRPVYDELARELVPPITQLAGSGLDLERVGSIAVVDRHGVIDQNVLIMRRLLDAVDGLRGGRPVPWVQAAARVPLSLYLGGLLGLLSRRVLGQYDPVLSLLPGAGGERPLLLIVEPNLAAFAAGAGLDPGQARRWIVLHELTHAWQFEGHPWLADHLTQLLRGLVVEPLRAVGLAGDAAGALPDPTARLRRAADGLAAQWRSVAGLQAVMSVLEGHGNYVMREVGRRHLADIDQLEAALHRRQSQRSLLDRLVAWVTGIRAKLQQYERGERFLRAVAAAGGPPLLARVWTGPDALPSAAELRRPDRWVARMQGESSSPHPAAPQPAPQPA